MTDRSIFEWFGRTVLVAIAVITLVALSGCGSDTPTPLESQPTLDEASEPAPGARDPGRPPFAETEEAPCPADPNTSTIPRALLLAGRNGSVVDPLCEYRVTLRNFFGQPVTGTQVTLEWGPFDYSSYNVCSTQPFPGMTYQNVGGIRRFTATTDANGVARFRIVGSGPLGGCAFPSDSSVQKWGKVFACGVELRPSNRSPHAFSLATPDLNGSSGVDLTDLALFGVDRNCYNATGIAHSRSDFNGDGAITVADLSIFGAIRFGNGSVQSCTF